MRPSVPSVPMFGQEQTGQLELSEYQTPAKRSLALWTATAWIALAMAEAIIILAQDGSGMGLAGRWALGAGMTLLGVYWVARYRECRRLEKQLAANSHEQGSGALTLAYRNAVRMVAAAGVASLVALFSLKWIVLAPPFFR